MAHPSFAASETTDIGWPAGGGTAVSWGAVLAGAAAAAALSLILLILGTGLGLPAMSPWASAGASAAAIGVSAIVWLAFTQIASSALGGYLAGRLRTKWADTHLDEVYFRDTAHGLLSWAVATLATAALLAGVIGSVVGGGVKAGAALGGTAAGMAGAMGMAATAGGPSAGGEQGPQRYALDALFRRTDGAAPPAASASAPEGGSTAVPAPSASAGTMAAQQAPAAKAEVATIFANALRTGTLSPEDQRYAAQRVAEQTGLSQEAAQQRVTDGFNRLQAGLRKAETDVKEAADTARKAAAYAALWMFVALLAGAFAASWMATWGGRQRDA